MNIKEKVKLKKTKQITTTLIRLDRVEQKLKSDKDTKQISLELFH